MRRLNRSLLTVALGLSSTSLAMGCMGVLVEEGAGTDEASSPQPSASASSAPRPGTAQPTGGGTGPAKGPPAASPAPAGTGASPPPAPATSAECTTAAPIPAPRLWRLSREQIARTYKALYDVTIDPLSLPPDGISDDPITRFDTSSEKNRVGDQLAAALREHAGAAARAVVARLGSACVHSAAANDACVAAFVKEQATRAWRRPATGAEVDRLTAFWKAARTAHDAGTATRMTLESILQSPHFLYRFELGEPSGPRAPLGPYELASQLSYLIADSPPDQPLLEAAARGELTSPQMTKLHAERLLATPGARGKLRAFFRSYLGLDALTHGKPKDASFTTFTDGLRRGLVTESETFVEKALFDERGTWDTLWTARHSYQSAAVAKHYGTSQSATSFSRVDLPAGRMGLLSHAGVLAAHSNANATSPVHRGLFYYQTLLCRSLPLPPTDAASQTEKLTDPANPNRTQREAWAYFGKTFPACAGCHGLFHPLGLGLETFDPIGRARVTDNGKPIDPALEVTWLGKGLDGSFKDGLELARAVAVSDEGRACLALQLSTFAFGRRVVPDEERCRLEALAERFARADLSVAALLVAMTEDESFYFRRWPSN
jgi:hypothetical protein